MPNRALEHLSELMSGQQPSQNDLTELLASGEREKQWLEFKHGDAFKNHKPAALLLREYVAGFANADGGILIGGVSNDRKTITGCKAPGGGDLKDWASRCLDPLAGFFSPPPRIESVNHPNGEVLFVATSRAPALIQTDGIYYLRFHDQTKKVPDYLISDLVLGRRQHPNLDLSKAIGLARGIMNDRSGLILKFVLEGTIQNVGMTWARETDVGLVGCSMGWNQAINEGLSSFVTILPQEQRHAVANIGFIHVTISLGEIQPFGNQNFRISQDVELPVTFADWRYVPCVWHGALYLLTRGSPPLWYQVELDITNEQLSAINKGQPAIEVRVCRLVGDRAELALKLPKPSND